MLRIVTVTQDQFDYIWARLQPQSRRTVDWIGCDSLILSDHDGPILVTISKVDKVPPEQWPDRVLQFLRGFEQHLPVGTE